MLFGILFSTAIASSDVGVEMAESSPEGCCYTLGFGAMMVPCCQVPVLELHGRKGEAGYNDTVPKKDCPDEKRIGGATKFEAGIGCRQLEKQGWTNESTEPCDYEEIGKEMFKVLRADFRLWDAIMPCMALQWVVQSAARSGKNVWEVDRLEQRRVTPQACECIGTFEEDFIKPLLDCQIGDPDRRTAYELYVHNCDGTEPRPSTETPEHDRAATEKCPWLENVTSEKNVLKCMDGSYCNGKHESWSCCNDRGGRMMCPYNLPYMCDDKSCGGGQAYCCSNRKCLKSGPRPCN